jgi:hypothetical protein
MLLNFTTASSGEVAVECGPVSESREEWALRGAAQTLPEDKGQLPSRFGPRSYENTARRWLFLSGRQQYNFATGLMSLSLDSLEKYGDGWDSSLCPNGPKGGRTP